MMTADPTATERRIARLDALVEALEAHPDPEVRAAAGELVRGIQWIHAEGLGRLTELLAESPELFHRALDDPAVSNLLFLHDLVVVDEVARAREALDSVRPFLRDHGGEVELLGVDEGVVRIRLLGACDGCPSSSATLRQGIERALADRLPGFRGLDASSAAGAPRVDGRDRGPDPTEEPVSFVPVENLAALEERIHRRRTSNGAGEAAHADDRWATIARLDRLTPGLHGFLVENYPVLVARRDHDLRAFQNTCPGSILPLHLGTIEDDVLACPWHGCRFDLATGERLGGSGPPLHRLESATVDGDLRVRC